MTPISHLPSFALRYRLQESKTNEHWEPLTLSWATSASDWLVAHDMYHHLPADTGTLSEELASLGAEYYVCFEGLRPDNGDELTEKPGLNALTRSAAGIVGMTYDLPGEPGHFYLVDANSPEVPRDVAELFEAAQASAISEMDLLVGDFPAEEVEWHKAFQSLAQPGVIASWLRKGYFDAKERFPDQEATRQGFEATIKAVKRARGTLSFGQEICLQLTGYHTQLTLGELAA